MTQLSLKKETFRLTPIALLVLLLPRVVLADNYFNPAFLSGDASAVADLSRFEGDGQAPGTYRVDVYLNDNFIATRDIEFRAAGTAAPAPDAAAPAPDAAVAVHPASRDGTGLTPCLTVKSLDTMGVNIQAFPALKGLKPETCIDITQVIPDAATTLNFEQLRLDISVPQAAMNNRARGYIPPEQWDEGINALLLNYNFTGSESRDRSSSAGGTDNNYFLGLNGGINLGPWRLRDYSTWSYSHTAQGDTHDWQHISTYVERTVKSLKGELTAGDAYTSSDVFDSLSIRGVQLASDDNMLPDSQRGFAPTVRGIAHSNAQVTIKQNGYTIYQSYVQPGAFEINDLFPTSSSGDLTVEVKESDGSVSSYVVPYSAVPVLQREGRVKYAVSAGKFRSNGDQQDDVSLAQGTLIWGLSHGVTGYGGTQWSEHYRALALGLGVNMGDYGALSMDVTQARSELADDSVHHGQSLRFLYAKSLNDLGTNIQLLGYRYSTKGFYTLEDTTYRHMDGYTVDTQDGPVDVKPDLSDYYNLYYNKRGKAQINLSQQIGEQGSVFVTASRQSYWNTDETESLLQLGYNGNLDGVSYSLSYNYSKSPGLDKGDNIFSLSLSLPLGRWLSPTGGDSTQRTNNAYATYSASTDTHGNMTQNAGLSGTLLSDNNLSYTVQQGYQNHGSGASGTASLAYDGTYGQANIGYNYSGNGDYQQVNYGLSGGLVAHRHGITLSQPLGDTNVLIAAPGAAGVGVESNDGVRTDWRGYAVVPYATTYRRNRMALDTGSLPDDVDIDDAVASVVPTKGALVEAQFKASVGLRALITLLHNGKPVPFGATVSRSDAGSSSIVGDEGQVYLSGLDPAGSLTAQWGEGAGQRCTVQYRLPAKNDSQPVSRLKGVCQ